MSRPLFAVRLGAAPLFLASDRKGRAGCVDRAARFSTEAEAQCEVDRMLKGQGFALPWAVVPLEQQTGGAA